MRKLLFSLLSKIMAISLLCAGFGLICHAASQNLTNDDDENSSPPLSDPTVNDSPYLDLESAAAYATRPDLPGQPMSAQIHGSAPFFKVSIGDVSLDGEALLLEGGGDVTTVLPAGNPSPQDVINAYLQPGIGLSKNIGFGKLTLAVGAMVVGQQLSADVDHAWLGPYAGADLRMKIGKYQNHLRVSYSTVKQLDAPSGAIQTPIVTDTMNYDIVDTQALQLGPEFQAQWQQLPEGSELQANVSIQASF